MNRACHKIQAAILVAFQLCLPSVSMACGGFAPKAVVLRPATPEEVSAMPAFQKMTVGDKLGIVLPPPRNGMVWEVPPRFSAELEQFTPADESGENVFAWRLVKPGAALIFINEKNVISKESNTVRAIAVTADPQWEPPVRQLDETNQGQTITFSQRDVLKIKLAHPGNAEGYWQIERGLNSLDVEYGGLKATRGEQLQSSDRRTTEITINTTHMPGDELELSFHATVPGASGAVVQPVIYKLKGWPATMC